MNLCILETFFLFIVTSSNYFSDACQNINNYHDMAKLNQPFHQPCYDIIISDNQINLDNRCCIDFMSNIICTQEYKECYREYPNYSHGTSNTNTNTSTSISNNLKKEQFVMIIILAILNFIAIIILIYLYRIHENIIKNEIVPNIIRLQPASYTNQIYQDTETDTESNVSQDNTSYDYTYDNLDNVERYNELYPDTDTITDTYSYPIKPYKETKDIDSDADTYANTTEI